MYAADTEQLQQTYELFNFQNKTTQDVNHHDY